MTFKNQKHYFKTSLVYLCILTGGFTFGQGFRKANTEQVKNKYLDLSYDTQSESQKLDIYLPATLQDNKKYPVIVQIHGGAFMFGDKQDGQLNPALKGLEKDYAVVSINYRLSREAQFPAQVIDVDKALQFIKANAEKYHLDASKVILWGGSAGGYLSVYAGLSSNSNPANPKIIGVIDWYGPIKFGELDAQFSISKKGQANHNAPDSPESKLLGMPLPEAKLLLKKADPLQYLDKNDPAFFIQHGDVDAMIPVEQSINLAKSLTKVLGKQKVQMEIIKGANHADRLFETDSNVEKVFQFIAKVSK